MEFLKFAELVIPLQQRVPVGEILLQLSISPIRGEYAPDIGEQKIVKRAPIFVPVEFGANGYQAVSLMFDRYDGTPKPLHQTASVFVCIMTRHLHLHEPEGV